MPSASTTWPGMCGNGCKIATMTTTPERPATDRRGSSRREVKIVFVSPAAVPGGTFRPSNARPTASGSLPSTGTPFSAFGWPERYIVDVWDLTSLVDDEAAIADIESASIERTAATLIVVRGRDIGAERAQALIIGPSNRPPSDRPDRQLGYSLEVTPVTGE